MIQLTERFLTAAELAALLSMAPLTIKRKAARGDIPCYAMPRGHQTKCTYRFRWSEVEVWLASMRRGPSLPTHTKTPLKDCGLDTIATPEISTTKATKTQWLWHDGRAEEMLLPATVAEILGCSYPKILELAKKNVIKSVDFSRSVKRHRPRFSRADVEGYLSTIKQNLPQKSLLNWPPKATA
jgi:excisionase family DNA binding protein